MLFTGPAGRGTLVRVVAGEIWLTQEGAAEDYVLVGGQSFRLDRNGAALAHAFRGSVVCLEEPQSRPGAFAGLRRVWAAFLEPLARTARDAA